MDIQVMDRDRTGSEVSGRAPAAVPQAVKVLVADPQPVILAGIARVVERCPWLVVAGTARTGRAAIDAAEQIRPDMLITDVRLPDMRTVEVLRAVRGWTPRLRVLIFTAESNRAATSALTAEGVDAIVDREADPAELLDIAGKVGRGERPEHSHHSDPGPWPAPERPLLTHREYQILSRVTLGKTNGEIARELGLAQNTVKTYFQRTLEKLRARNRVEAVSRAAELGLL